MKQRMFILFIGMVLTGTYSYTQPMLYGQKTIGGSNNDDFTTMALTKDGGLIAGGYSYSDSSGDKTQNSRGLYDYWVVKLDANGNIQWDKTIGGNDFDYLTAIQQCSDGGYIAGGYTNSKISGDKTGKRQGKEDYWIVRLDSTGRILWDKVIGGSQNDYLEALQQTADGGYILGGYSRSNISGDKTENSRIGTNDYWIVKLDSAGTIEWNKTIGGSDYDLLEALQQTEGGGYILGGYSYSNMSGDKTENNKGGVDYWIVRLNQHGIIQWDKTIGGSGDDYLTDVQLTSEGGYILGGHSGSNISGDKTENSRGSEDYWVAKLSKDGTVQWDKTIGGYRQDVCSSVKEIAKNRYVIGGYSYSGVSGDKTQRSRGESDYWLVKLKYINPDSVFIAGVQNKVQLQTAAANSKNFIFYPNPAEDKITVQNHGKAVFTLASQSGKTMLIKVIENSGSIDVSHLSAGVYYLTNTATGITQKVVVSR